MIPREDAILTWFATRFNAIEDNLLQSRLSDVENEDLQRKDHVDGGRTSTLTASSFGKIPCACPDKTPITP